MRVGKERWREFLFRPESDKWLTVLRIGLGLQVALYTLSLRTEWNHFFRESEGGLIRRDLAETILGVDSAFVPRLGWLVTGGGHFGLGEDTMLSLAWIGLLISGCCLLAGIFSRAAAIVAWFLHLCAVKSGGLLGYGVDNFTTIGLFYLMIAPLPDRWSLDRVIRRIHRPDPARLGFHRRILQIHLCFIYFFGGIAKCFGVGWWNGTSLWRALTRPPFDIIPAQLLVRWQVLLLIVGIFVCVLETCYPVFIWWKKTRAIWLMCIIGMHVAIGATMGLHLFALIMIILNIAAFGPDFVFGRKAPFLDAIAAQAAVT